MAFSDLDFLEENFIHYAKENTQSKYANKDQVPTTPGQVKMMQELAKQVQDYGVKSRYNEKTAFAIGCLPANTAGVSPIGFFAHVDTVEYDDRFPIRPQVHRNYQGEKIILDEANGVFLDPAEFPDLRNLQGQTLISSDGKTVLGTDDKAGVVSLLAALKYLHEHPEIAHGDLYVAFGPDEEIGLGGQRFDPADFPGVEFAYTLDNGRPGDFEYETFNASAADLTIKGTVVHPGEAYGLLVNATTIMTEFLAALPQDQVPEKSRGHEGFIMVTDAQGSVDSAHVGLIIRDFDWDKFLAKEDLVKNLVNRLGQKYGPDRFDLQLRRQYENIYNGVKDRPYVVNLALDSYKKAGLTPRVQTFRGGTDGNFITKKGIPTPNLFNGGGNYHGRYEYVTVEQMDKLTEVLVTIAAEHARQSQTGRDERPLEKYW
ncbi:MAG: peptidase T [Lacticaseibacillus absianus]